MGARAERDGEEAIRTSQRGKGNARWRWCSANSSTGTIMGIKKRVQLAGTWLPVTTPVPTTQLLRPQPRHGERRIMSTQRAFNLSRKLRDPRCQLSRDEHIT